MPKQARNDLLKCDRSLNQLLFQPGVSHVAKRSGPGLCAVMRLEKSSGGASDEILNTVLQTISRQNEKRSRCLIVSVVQEAIADSPRVQQTPGSAHTRHLRSQHIRLRFRPRSLVATCVYNRVAITRKIDDHAFQPWLQVCASFGIRNVAKNRTSASPEWRMRNQTISLPDLIFRHRQIALFRMFFRKLPGDGAPALCALRRWYLSASICGASFSFRAAAVLCICHRRRPGIRRASLTENRPEVSL